MDIKRKLIIAVIALGLVLIAVFQMGLGGSFTRVDTASDSESSAVPNISSGDLEIVSMNPPELKQKKDIVIVPTQVIEMTFNKKLENAPETKIITDPSSDIKIELSDDRMTVRIIPVKPYKLGQGYTLFLKKETKFDGGKTYGRDEDFHFTIIDYKGV